MDKISEEMKYQMDEIFEAHLPKQQSKWIKHRLELVEELEGDVEELAEERDDLQDRLEELENDLNELVQHQDEADRKMEEAETRFKELNEREESIEERERNLKVEVLELKLSESDKRAEEIQGLVKTMFKSPVIRRSITDNESRFFDEKYLNNGGYELKETGKDRNITEETRREVE